MKSVAFLACYLPKEKEIFNACPTRKKLLLATFLLQNKQSIVYIYRWQNLDWMISKIQVK